MTSIPDLLRRIGGEAVPADVAKRLPRHIRGSKDMLTALMWATYQCALDGEAWAVTFIAERTEGKVRDNLEITGDVGPLVVVLPPEPPQGSTCRSS